MAVGTGSGAGLTSRNLGDNVGGVETHALNVNEMPSHSHSSNAVGGTIGLITANGEKTATSDVDSSGGEPNLHTLPQALTIDSNGNGAGHNNMQPFIVLRYLIKY